MAALSTAEVALCARNSDDFLKDIRVAGNIWKGNLERHSADVQGRATGYPSVLLEKLTMCSRTFIGSH